MVSTTTGAKFKDELGNYLYPQVSDSEMDRAAVHYRVSMEFHRCLSQVEQYPPPCLNRTTTFVNLVVETREDEVLVSSLYPPH